MTIMELKEFINNGTVPSDFLVFISKESSFLVNQYVSAIAQLAEGGVNKINSIYEPQQSSVALLTAVPGSINILKVETFDERAEDYSQFENTIVICEQIDKSIAKNVESYVIKFPKLEEWQIFDYAKTICPALDDNDILWLVKATNNDINRVLNELAKIALFDKNEQKAIFAAVQFEQQSDLYNADLFTIVNALVEGDKRTLFEFLRNNGDLEPVVLANRAFVSLKNILFISQTDLSAEDCGVSAKQRAFIKKKYHSLNIEAVKQKIKFLTNFDLMLKTSRLDLNKYDMLSYLINNLCYKIVM